MAIHWETLNRLRAFVSRSVRALPGAIGRLKGLLPSRYVVVPAVLLAWVLSGLYIIEPSELGAVLRFGKLNRMAEPGLHYHLPRPVERVRKCDVERIRRYEIHIGARDGEDDPRPRDPGTAGGPLFLTVDENLIQVDLVVQARVSSAVDYLFHVRQPEETVQDAALAALSTVIGRHGFDAALTVDRPGIEAQVGALLQELLDRYGSGMQVVAAKLKRVEPPEPVREAFSEVSLAMERQRRTEAEALRYETALLPRARGDAAGIVQAAEAYGIQRVSQAKGDAARFLAQLAAYRQAREVTRKRLYLEAAEQIVGRASKVVVASETQVVWPPLPLKDLGLPAVSQPTSDQGGK